MKHLLFWIRTLVLVGLTGVPAILSRLSSPADSSFRNAMGVIMLVSASFLGSHLSEAYSRWRRRQSTRFIQLEIEENTRFARALDRYADLLRYPKHHPAPINDLIDALEAVHDAFQAAQTSRRELAEKDP